MFIENGTSRAAGRSIHPAASETRVTYAASRPPLSSIENLPDRLKIQCNKTLAAIYEGLQGDEFSTECLNVFENITKGVDNTATHFSSHATLLDKKLNLYFQVRESDDMVMDARTRSEALFTLIWNLIDHDRNVSQFPLDPTEQGVASALHDTPRSLLLSAAQIVGIHLAADREVTQHGQHRRDDYTNLLLDTIWDELIIRAIETPIAKGTGIGAVYKTLDQLAGSGGGIGEPGNRPRDVRERLLSNANTLVKKGLKSSDQVESYFNDAWRHDVCLAGFGLGITRNIGYELSMTAFNEFLAKELPEEILANPSLLGLVIGIGVGGVDAVFNMIGNPAVESRLYNPRCENGQLPGSLQLPNREKQILLDATRSALLNVVKNSVRIVAPPIQGALEAKFFGTSDGTIDRTWSNRIDTSLLDGGGGFVSNGVDSMLRLTSGNSFNQRLALREDLEAVVDKSFDGWAKAAWDVAKGGASGALSLVHRETAGVVPYVSLMIGAFICGLFSANATIDQTGVAHARAAENRTNATDWGSRAPVSMITAQRAESMMFMGIMNYTLNTTTSLLVVPVLHAFNRLNDSLFDRISSFLSGRSTANAFKPMKEEV